MGNEKNEPKQSCFVVMPFGGIWDDYYAELYSPAVEQAGLKAVRADDVFSAGSVLQDWSPLTAQGRAVALLRTMGAQEAIRQLMNEGYPVAMAEDAVYVASKQLGRPRRNTSIAC